MSRTRLTSPPVPFDAPEKTRAYLDDQMRRLGTVVNDAASVTEDETISGTWQFDGVVNFADPGLESGSITVNDTTFATPVKINHFGGDKDGSLTLHQHADSTTHGPTIIFARARGDTQTHSNVQDGDILGNHYFVGRYSSSYEFGARIHAEVDGTPGVDDMPTSLVFSTTADGAKVSTEALRLTPVQGAEFAGTVQLNTSLTILNGTDSIALSHDGTDANLVGTATADLNISGVTNVTLPDSSGIAFGTGTDFVVTYDGSDLLFTPAAANDGLNLKNGTQLKVYDSTDADYVELLADGTVSRVNSSGSDSLYLDNGVPGFGIKAMSLADDATGTWTLPDSRPGGMLFLTASSTTDNVTGEYAILYVDDAATITTIASSAATISVGNGTNPDVDGDINIWSGTQGIISVKNRRSATRRIQLYMMGA